jgi:hypothetical protein
MLQWEERKRDVTLYEVVGQGGNEVLKINLALA